jgi:hypothetical protein
MAFQRVKSASAHILGHCRCRRRVARVSKSSWSERSCCRQPCQQPSPPAAAARPRSSRCMRDPQSHRHRGQAALRGVSTGNRACCDRPVLVTVQYLKLARCSNSLCMHWRMKLTAHTTPEACESTSEFPGILPHDLPLHCFGSRHNQRQGAAPLRPAHAAAGAARRQPARRRR